MTAVKYSFCNRSGDIYKSFTFPCRKRKKRLFASSTVHRLSILVAPISCACRASTWSFIKDNSGEITTVTPLLIKAGIWKHRDFPAPVGIMANTSRCIASASMTSSCPGRKDVYPKYCCNISVAFMPSPMPFPFKRQKKTVIKCVYTFYYSPLLKAMLHSAFTYPTLRAIILPSVLPLQQYDLPSYSNSWDGNG